MCFFRNWKLSWRNWSSFKKVTGCNDTVKIDVTCYSGYLSITRVPVLVSRQVHWCFQFILSFHIFIFPLCKYNHPLHYLSWMKLAEINKSEDNCSPYRIQQKLQSKRLRFQVTTDFNGYCPCIVFNKKLLWRTPIAYWSMFIYIVYEVKFVNGTDFDATHSKKNLNEYSYL